MRRCTRDALVLTRALARVRREHAALRHYRGTVRLAARLQEELSTARRRLVAQPDALHSQCRRLHRIERRVRDWRLGRHGWSVLGPALCHIYRGGRLALPSATDHPADAALHEWRKQTKYLRYAAKMLAPIRPAALGAVATQAAAIAEQLGDAHDLALPQERAAGL